MDGAKEVLASLKRDGYRILLYTAGDRDVQTKKLESLNIREFFDSIYIISNERKTGSVSRVRTKDETVLKEILDKEALDVSRTWMVGNSPHSDINPALLLGLKCIWIRSNLWDYDKVNSLLPGLVWQISSLREIPSILLREATKKINPFANLAFLHRVSSDAQ
jgi:putative hydrolase of the HAD superfamily